MTEDILIRVKQTLSGNSLPETKAQLKALQSEMNATNRESKEGEARYKALGTAAGNLQKHIVGLSREQKGLAYEVKNTSAIEREAMKEKLQNLKEIERQTNQQAKLDRELTQRVRERQLSQVLTPQQVFPQSGVSTMLGSIDALRMQKNYFTSVLRTGQENGLQITAQRYNEIINKLKTLNPLLKEAEKNLNNVGKTSKMSSNQWLEWGENLTVVSAGIITVFNNVKKYIGDAVQKSLDFQKALDGLKFASDSITFSNLKNFNNQFKFGSVFSSKDILQSETFLSLQGRTEEQIKKVITAAMNLAAVTGDDLDSAVKKLDMTFEGSIGRMGKLDESLKNLTPEQLRNGEAIDIIAKKYEGFAKNQAETLSGKLQILQKNWSGLERKIGDSIIEQLSVTFGILNKNVSETETTFTKFGKAIETVIGLFGTWARVVPNLYNTLYGVYTGIKNLINIIGSLFNGSITFQSAINNMIDALVNIIPLFRAFKEGYNWIAGSNSNEKQETELFTKSLDNTVNNALKINEAKYKAYEKIKSEAENQVKTNKGNSGKGSRGDITEKELSELDKLIKEIEFRLEYDKEFHNLSLYQLDSYKKQLEVLQKLATTDEERLKSQKQITILNNLMLEQSTRLGTMGIVEGTNLNEEKSTLTKPQSKEEDLASWFNKNENLPFFKERAKEINILSDSLSILSGAFQSFFDVLKSGEGVGNAFKELLKSILISTINFIQGMLLAAISKSFIDSVLTFGATLLKELPEILLATAGLESAKALIGSLSTGTDNWRGGWALVGDDRGKPTRYSELVNLPKGTKVYNNSDTMKMLTGITSQNKQPDNITVIVNSEVERSKAVKFFRNNFPNYEKLKNDLTI